MINVGVIGCGGIGKLHLKKLIQMDSAKVTAACDINPANLESFGQEAGLPEKHLYQDYSELLDKGDVDAVVICLPNRLHSIVSIASLEAGKHVFCEKPTAINHFEANKMVEAARKNGKKLLIGLQNRFRGESLALKSQMRQKALGVVYYAKCGWLRRNGVPGWGSWFTRKKDAGAGPIFDIGVHVLDLTLWLMDDFKPNSVFASSYAKFGPRKKGLSKWGIPEPNGYYDVEDLACAILRMESGASIFFEVSWASHISKPKFYIELMGDKAGFDYESTTIFSSENSTTFDKKIHYNKQDPYLEEMNHFLDCIKNDKEPITKPEEILGLQKALDMILKSSKENRVVTAKEV